MNYQHLLKQVNEYVLAYYSAHADPRLIYHDLKHTETVANRAIEIANHYQLNDRDYFVVATAAWFHDTGYMLDVKQHEEHSALLAETFLKTISVSESDIKDVKGCIMATKMPQSPNNLMEKILCDADLYHLGTAEFDQTDKLLRKETNILHGTDLSKREWRRKSIGFLAAHHYHTDYAQVLLNGAKQRKIEELKEKVALADKKSPEENVVEVAKKDDKKEDKKDDQKEDKKSDKPKVTIEVDPVTGLKRRLEEPKKGIETMFRISSTNHQRLSDMADNKAHIMITVNSIILSAIISLVLRRLSDNQFLIVPTFILLAISLLTIIFSILATRPSIPEGVFSRKDVDNRSVNLLFFGNFYKMSLEEYNYGMEKMMDDKEFLYGSLIKDLYAQGVVLGKKYRLLRIAYNIFMFGLIVSVLAFILFSTFFADKPII
jgi:predicted metal-dependent HD superfamily phosphohydrolase